MKRKKGLPGFTQTEPELIIGAMERHPDWAVVVCLLGGGQEINTGEAGISAGLDGVRTLFPGRDVFISPHLTDSEYAASNALERLSGSRAGAARATFESLACLLILMFACLFCSAALLLDNPWGRKTGCPS